MPLKINKRASIGMIPELIDNLSKLRDDYKVRYQVHLEDFKTTEKSLRENYIGKELANRRQDNQDRFDAAVNDLRSKFSDTVVQSVGEIERAVIDEVSKPATSTIISGLLEDNIPVSKTEFQILREQFSNNYWNDKLLCTLAERNGIMPDDVPATADELMDTLHSIVSESDAFLETWKGNEETSPMNRMNLHPRHLQQWEDQCTKGFAIRYTPQQRASRALDAVRQASNYLDAVRAIHTLLRNTEDDEQTQELILYGISQDDRLYDLGIVQFLDSDYKKVLTEYRNGERRPPQEKDKPVKLDTQNEAVARSLSQRAREIKAELGDNALSHAYANSGSSESTE